VPKQSYWKRLLLLLALAIVVIVFFQTDLASQLNLESLQENRDQLQSFVSDNFLISVLIYILAYAAIISFSLPGGAVMTITGGFLFGWWGLPMTVVGATIGATINFLLARYIIGDWVQTKYAKQLEKFNAELEKNGKNYLLSIRFVPAFPFWLVNLLSGLTKLRTIDYIWATTLGIIPGTAAYTFAGIELMQVDSLSDVLSPGLIIALLLLALLSIAPTIWKKLRAKKTVDEVEEN
jgi:uncharacterized membrane protein YdjX (TVP38/TMEM64 family)